MQWNLTDHLSSGTERFFHLPVASDPTGGNARPVITPNQYSDLVAEPEIDGMPCLEIRIIEPTVGFPPDGALPAAVIRLHAMCSGALSYRPQLGSLRNCLILELPPIWLRVAIQVRWFERWLEADCIPKTVIYENVDPGQLRELLMSMPTTPQSADRLLFPKEVVSAQVTKEVFIDQFLSGTGERELVARTGAYIGVMALEELGISRFLRLHVRYEGHSDAEPRPMVPRELFNLFFGDDSAESGDHPLLKAIEQAGQNDTATQPPTGRMLLRPPLRTHARLMWEAGLEIPDQDRWEKGGSLGSDKLINSIDEFDRNNSYANLNKCNILVFEMLLRSGFRVRMRRYLWNGRVNLTYHRVNRVVADARRSYMSATEPSLLGFENEIPWGRRWDALLSVMPPNQQAEAINRMMEDEGRAFYLVQELKGTVRDNSGHTMLLHQVVETVPSDWPANVARYTVAWEDMGSPDNGSTLGLLWIVCTVYNALGIGLRFSEGTYTPAWPDLTSHAAASVNNDLLMIEALPGADPHTLIGLRSLCSIKDDVPIN